MPYIPEERRHELGDGTEITEVNQPRTSGELNFLFTRILREYLDERGTSYATMNDIIGALEACKLEFYRRVIVPYEETKRDANGDVYER